MGERFLFARVEPEEKKACREFTCQIGSPFTAPITGTTAAVMTRGVKGEQPTEPIVEQPSPFD